jgi:GNAT superfamily N-acetyltransferase
MAGEADTASRARLAVEAGYVVRPMQASDASRVAQVHVRVWHEAYASLMPAEHLAGLDVAEFSERWRARLAHPTADGPRHLVGLSPDGAVVGLGTAGPSRDPEPATTWELWALNVLASEHGTGLADLMMSELIGTRACHLWVLRGNARAVSFYTRHRFVADGRTKLHVPTGITEDHMVRAVDPPLRS